jgi:4-alpha-glucanotransferase
MNLPRKSGILLHPTSFPGPDGIGDLGPECYSWIDFLHASGCSLWQILPLGPTGYGDSPYQCFSAFAGNPYLVSPVLLLDQNLLERNDFLDRPEFPVDNVDFGPVIEWKLTILDRAFRKFTKSRSKKLSAAYQEFCQAQAAWLDDFALFMSIKEVQGGGSWDGWPVELRTRQVKALHAFSEKHHSLIEKHKFRQFLFFTQWENVKQYAHDKGIQIIGDIPIFIAYDSADAWSNPDLFYIGKDGKPTHVAGVPPDYFSPTGQLWGNPLYKWSAHKKQNYRWWIERFSAVLKTVDIVRLDHFRGFAGYWEIPAGMPTAEIGRWAKGPGAHFLSALNKAFNGLPIIAEDLGLITPDVVELRDSFKLPGMKILQFAFAGTPEDPFLPHNYPVNCVAYTGTHDNDTTVGWYAAGTEQEKDYCRRYLAVSGENIARDLIREIWKSTAAVAITTLQDLLSLGTEARMNFPGKPAGNWGWRFQPEDLSQDLLERLQELNYLYLR